MSYFYFQTAPVGAVFRISNSKGSQIVATGINDLDSPPNAIILRTTVNPVGLPEGLGGNGCIVIQQNPNNAFNCQLAFSFEVIRLLYAEKEIAMLGQTGSTSLPNKIVRNHSQILSMVQIRILLLQMFLRSEVLRMDGLLL